MEPMSEKFKLALECTEESIRSLDVREVAGLYAHQADTFEGRAYDDTSAEECAAWLHASGLARELASTLERIGKLVEEQGA